MSIKDNVKKDKKFVVLRNGFRVSDAEYSSKEDAKDEFSYWEKVIKRWPDESKIEIAEYDENKHRI